MKKVEITPEEARRALVKRNTDISTLLPEIEIGKRSFKFIDKLFQKQKDVINDPSKRKIALCSRQAGKTWLACAYLAYVALTQKRAICIYLGLTIAKAEELIWGDLQDFNEKWSLGFEFNEAKLIASHPTTESKIYLRGTESTAQKEKTRGSRANLIIVDEAQFHGNKLESFIQDIIEPATMAKGGSVLCLGTPGPVCWGLFYELTNSKASINKDEYGWSIHKWTALDNPYIDGGAQNFLNDVLKRYSWTENHPKFLREYRGEWVESSDLLAYKFNYNKNTIVEDKVPTGLTYTMGIDFGYSDSTALVIVGTRKDDNYYYVVDALKVKEKTASEVAQFIEVYRQRHNVKSMHGDYAGGGKFVMAEYTKAFRLPIINADKRKREIKIDFLNDDLIAGKIKIVVNKEKEKSNPYLLNLIEELCSIQRKDKTSYEFLGNSEDHLSDSLRYAHAVDYSKFRKLIEKPILTREQKFMQALRKDLEKDLENDKNPWYSKYVRR